VAGYYFADADKTAALLSCDEDLEEFCDLPDKN
jgi:hypothetical protein